MRVFVVLLCLLALPATAEEMKLAQANLSELRELVRTQVLSHQVNEPLRQELFTLNADANRLQAQFDTMSDQEKTAAMLTKIQDLQQRKQALDGRLDLMVKKALLDTVREVSKGRFAIIVDSSASEAIIYKNAELVDLTGEIKEKLIERVKVDF
jgi:hypothetical protein